MSEWQNFVILTSTLNFVWAVLESVRMMSRDVLVMSSSEWQHVMSFTPVWRRSDTMRPDDDVIILLTSHDVGEPLWWCHRARPFRVNWLKRFCSVTHEKPSKPSFFLKKPSKPCQNLRLQVEATAVRVGCRSSGGYPSIDSEIFSFVTPPPRTSSYQGSVEHWLLKYREGFL